MTALPRSTERTRGVKRAAPVAIGKPIWTCEVCRKPIIAGGEIAFNYQEWRAYRIAQQRLDAEYVGQLARPLTSYADPVRWHPRHYRCGPPSGEYSIDIERVASWADVAQWAAHLHDKTWFADTDWGNLLAGAGVFRWFA